MALARFQRTIVDASGNTVAVPTVTVRDQETNAIVNIYSDRDGLNALTNPFTGTAEGFVAFHVAGGAYKITATSGAFTAEWTWVGIGTASEYDFADITDYIDTAIDIDAGRGSPFGRPGATPTQYFISTNLSSAGGPKTSLANIPSDKIVSGDYGEVVRLTNEAKAIAWRWPMRIEQGNFYEFTAIVQRISDPANPATSTVSVGVRWMDEDYVEISSTAIVLNDLTVTSGRRFVQRVVGLDFLPPSGAVYFRPYAVAIGTDHITDIEVIDSRDITNAFGVSQEIITPFSGRVSVAGDSLSGVYYTLPGKAWINVLSGLTDWQLINFSLSGDDTLELFSRLTNGTTIYGPFSIRDHQSEYVLIPLFANDSTTRLTRTRLFIQNFRRLIKAIRSLGARPVVVTEGRKLYGIEQAAMSRLAQEEGALYWEISSEYFHQDVTRDADYHYSDHPGVRHTVHYSDAIRRRFSELHRPRTSLKVFRPRYRRQIFNPVASWTFDGGTTRCVPTSAYIGTLVSGAAIVTDSERGFVYEATTTGQRMTLGTFSMPASYTLVMRVNPTSFASSRNLFSGITAGRLVIMLNTANLWIRHGSGSVNIDVAHGMTEGAWHTVAVTYDATKQVLKGYVDGVLLATATGVSAHNCTDPQVGASGTSSSFIGRIDDVNVWDRELEPYEVSVATQHRDGLLYNDAEERYALWRELEVGHYSLADAQRPYYDELQSITPSFLVQNNEYQKLRKGDSVSFIDKALLQFVIPGNAVNTYGLKLKVDAPAGASLYWLSRRPLPPSGGDAYVIMNGFVVAAYPAGIEPDATYSFGGVTFTVKTVTPNRDGAGYVIWCTPQSTVSTSGGTMTKISGNGPASIVCTARLNFNDGFYYDIVDQPYARWLSGSSINADLRENVATILSSNVIRQVIDYDTVTILIEKKGAFTLSDIELQWIGVPEKDRDAIALPPYRSGTELLTDTTFDGLSTSAWTAIGSAAEADPADGVLPYGVTKVVNVNASDMVRQSVTITADALLRKRFQVRVGCRIAPAKFTPSAGSPTDLQEFQELAPITSNTPDRAYLVVSIDNGDERFAVVGREPVGLAPVDAIIDFDIPNQRVWEDSSCRITISAEGVISGETATIQLYSASVIDCGTIN